MDASLVSCGGLKVIKEKKMRNLTTLCYIEKEDSYLMLHRVKKENDINKDKWIGVGGRLANVMRVFWNG